MATQAENVTDDRPQAVAQIPSMTGQQIRASFLDFYVSKGHKKLPSSSLVPEDPTVLLTIAGMLQFKPIFLGQKPPPVPCATTTQKCIRTNDIENVGVTARHHTFFEMLGNFSFGDYFKEQACKWAWELCKDVFHLPMDRVFVSVFEEDDDALALWRDVVGVPETHIHKMGAEDNFWASGPTGPCGPCSELYYDLAPERGLSDIDLDDDSRFIEFYNLVFMQLNRDVDGVLTPLENKNIDTGLGLERMAQILQGKPNNYETDLIMPIMEVAADVAGVVYNDSPAATKTSLKVIADHMRAVTYLVSDGVIPSNVGRGYIVRRLLRRVVLKARLLGVTKPFTALVARKVIAMAHDCDPTVSGKEARVLTEIEREEARFSSTLAAGQKVLDKVFAKAKDAGGPVSGDEAFLLYDTFGFPLELTAEVAETEGLEIDVQGFEDAMAAQRKRSQEAREDVDMTADAVLNVLATTVGSSTFVGYEELALAESTVLALLQGGAEVQEASEGTEVSIVLSKTPFYAESGGQIGDRGVLETSGGAQLRVLDVQNAAQGQIAVHKCSVASGTVHTKDTVSAEVNSCFRRRTRANHTATHLLQSALKQVLGEQVAQQGSLVQDDKLRFDFNLPRGMERTEIEQVEALINGWIEENTPLNTKVMDLTEAKAAGATAMFGEKYNDEVRVVSVPGVSMELCGGTHVSSTSEIAAFKVISEAGIASGIRRIEAVAGPALVPYVNSLDTVVRELAGTLKVASADIPSRVGAMQKEIFAKEKEIAALKAEVALAKSLALVSKAEDIHGVRVVVANLEGVDATSLQKAAVSLSDALGDPSAVVLGSIPSEAKVSIVASFSPGVVKGKKMNAGKFVGGLAKLCGGGGGGKPALAQAGGRLVEKLPEALSEATQLLKDGLHETK